MDYLLFIVVLVIEVCKSLYAIGTLLMPLLFAGKFSGKIEQKEMLLMSANVRM